MKTSARLVLNDLTLKDNDGRTVRLPGLFGDKHHLIVLHNMGEHCPNCALWGDEFNGMLAHPQRAAAFCDIGLDDPATQRAYARRRGWQALLYSAHGTRFIREWGFEGKGGDAQPGASIIERNGDGTLHVIEQVHVSRDQRIPSVLEVLWLLPDVEAEDLPWLGDKQEYSEARVS